LIFITAFSNRQHNKKNRTRVTKEKRGRKRR